MGQYDRVLYEGKQITRRQRQATNHVSSLTDRRYGLLIHLYQGSWRPETDYSGTTHTKAGVFDAYVYGMSTMKWDQLAEITRLWRREGHQAAFLRGPFVNMPWHWHILDLDTHRMDDQDGPYGATWQVGDYRDGGDGIGGRDPIPYRPKPLRKWTFRSN